MKWFFLVTGQLNDKRANQVDKFDGTFKKCKAVTVLSSAKLAVARTVQRQSMQSNVRWVSPGEYYRQSIFLPFSDGSL